MFGVDASPVLNGGTSYICGNPVGILGTHLEQEEGLGRMI